MRVFISQSKLAKGLSDFIIWQESILVPACGNLTRLLVLHAIEKMLLLSKHEQLHMLLLDCPDCVTSHVCR